MKKLLVGSVVFIAVLLIGKFGIAQDFQTSDLEGTWYAYLMETNPVDGTYWLYGSFTIDDAGNITGGSYTAPDDTVVNITGGTATLDVNGLMAGTIVAEGGLTGIFPSGKLNADKTVIGFVGSDINNSLDLGIAIKGGGSFATSDLEGTWYAYLMETNPVDGTYWLYGSFTIDDAGNITGGSYTAPDDTVVNITGGTATLDANGLMAGTIVAEGGLTGIFPSGKLNADKTVIGFVGSDINNSLDLGIAIKGGGSFATSDLEGTWYAYLMETNPVDGTYWLYGSFTIDDAGNITGGSYTAPDDTVVNITGGTATLDANGLMAGTIVAEGGLTGIFPSGKLNADKTVIGFVGSDINNSLDLGIAIKGGGIENGDDDGNGGGGGGGGGGTCFIQMLNQ